MVPRTRRRFLHVAAAVAGGLAGCNRPTSHAAHSASPTSGSNVPASDSETDPPTVLFRTDSETPPIRLSDSERKNADSFRSERLSDRITNELIDSRKRSRRLTVAADGDGEAVSSFVSATDFDAETLYAETIRVEECFRLQLCRVSWQADKVQTDYVRQLRPYDERCATDAHVFESRLVRLPVALDEDSVNSFGSTIGGSGRCDATGRARAEGSSGSGDPPETPQRATGEGEQ